MREERAILHVSRQAFAPLIPCDEVAISSLGLIDRQVAYGVDRTAGDPSISWDEYRTASLVDHPTIGDLTVTISFMRALSIHL